MKLASAKGKLYSFITGKFRVVVLLFSVILSFGLPYLYFDYDVDSFFDPEDKESRIYGEFRHHFENENNYLLLGICNEAGVFKKDFLNKIDSLCTVLESTGYFTKIISPTRLKETVIVFGVPQLIPVLHLNDEILLAKDKKVIYDNSIYKGLFFSHSGNSISIILQPDEPVLTRVDDFIPEINKIVQLFGFNEFHLAGRSSTQFYYKLRMKMEMQMFIILAAILVFGFIYLIFRSLLLAAVILFSLLLSLIAVYGSIGFSGYPVTLIQTLLPLLLIVTGLSPCIHLVSHFVRLKKKGRENSLEEAFYFSLIPNTVNTITTAAGFLTLFLFPAQPVKEFAIITSAGIIITYVIAVSSVVSFLSLLNLSFSSPASFFEKKLVYASGRTKDIRGRILMTFGLFVAAGVISYSYVPVNNYFLDDVPDGSELSGSLHFFEKEFSGIRPLEILLSPLSATDTLLTYDKLKEIERIQQVASDLYEPGFIFSPQNVVKIANRSFHSGNKRYEVIPESEEETDALVRKITRRRQWNKFIPVYDPASGNVRITGRTFDRGSRFYLEKDKIFENFCNGDLKYLRASITGVSHLVDQANKKISLSLLYGLVLMTLMIFIIILFYLRSVKLAVIAMIVNILPVLFAFILLLVTGVSLKVSSALMFTIVYGIAIDDTIHFLLTYRDYRKQSGNEEAIKKTIEHTGSAMLYTSLILSAGFSIFLFSAFGSISVFGFVIAFSLFFALACDLILLPVLLRIGVSDGN